ncbi:PDZ domain-containing protein [Nodosilinea sp. LEGE 07088]|uniref:S41 family peptidase n=1 Tax=Nodosilinea sp. LEGE 07088 TaxID=2777968 RepID=UPI00188044C3|nr:S41 family peptidase [Nodosilinea sp. LEGE 07088]MBE9139203.1 PDZ domain-containing protein [Nodosilinea sp. LEGE 07088]
MPRRYRWLISLALTAFISLSLGMLRGYRVPASLAQSNQLERFDAVWETVNDNFYDPDFNGVDWVAMADQYRSLVAQAASRSEQAELINQMLAELHTSHTHLYTADDPAYYQLLGIFYPRLAELRTQLEATFPDGKVEYVGIGAITTKKEGKTFVKAVLDGSPAAAAGLQVGDQILSVEGQPFQPVESFVDRADQPVSLRVQPSASPDSQREIVVTPQRYDGVTMFLDAMADSVQIVEKAGQQIGYVHIWSYAGDQYQTKLEEELIYGRLKDADALVLDLREGWGGAPPTALYPFTARGPSVTNVGRNGQAWTYHSQWKKPVVMLVNEGSRSAKEILAYGFQQYDIGSVVGSPTPGAVVAGRPFLMPDDSLLYVAVADVYVDGDVRLEGVGVTPDVVVPAPIAYAQGADPQKERAIATALALLDA